MVKYHLPGNSKPWYAQLWSHRQQPMRENIYISFSPAVREVNICLSVAALVFKTRKIISGQWVVSSVFIPFPFFWAPSSSVIKTSVWAALGQAESLWAQVKHREDFLLSPSQAAELNRVMGVLGREEKSLAMVAPDGFPHRIFKDSRKGRNKAEVNIWTYKWGYRKRPW